MQLLAVMQATATATLPGRLVGVLPTVLSVWGTLNVGNQREPREGKSQ
jgi:hypothetical protein